MEGGVMAGSASDHMRLVAALDRYELADSTADLLKTRVAYMNSQGWYMPLIAAARACGWTPFGLETAYAFAKRRVALLERQMPNHVIEARRAA
jgi:hypothetical protein